MLITFNSNGQYTQTSLLSLVSNILYQNHNQEDHNSARPGWPAKRRGETKQAVDTRQARRKK